MKSTIKLLGLLALLAVAVPNIGYSADKTTSSSDSKTPSKSKSLPLRGTVDSVTDKLLTLKGSKEKREYVISADTKILDNSEEKKPAKLSDVKPGGYVTGSYTKSADGTKTLVHLYAAPKKSEKSAKSAATTTTPAATTDSSTDTPKKKKKKKTDTTTDSTTTPTTPKSN